MKAAAALCRATALREAVAALRGETRPANKGKCTVALITEK